MIKEISNIYEYRAELFKAVITSNNREAIKYLKVENFNFWEVFEDRNFTVLHRAVYNNSNYIVFSIVEILYERLEREKAESVLKQFVNIKTDTGDTALAYASYRGNIEIIKLLINKGADIFTLTKSGQNMLHIAAQGDQPESILYFMNVYKMDLDSRDESGSTPLHWACHTGSELCLNYLIACGANVNSKDDQGITPLHLASITDKTRMIKKLLQNGADRYSIDNLGRTPLSIAIQRSKQANIDILSEDDNTICSCLCLEQPIRKSDKSAKNLVFFILIHIVFEFLVYVTVIPCFSSHLFISYFYICFFIFLMIIFANLSFSDPGTIPRPKKANFINLIENHVNIVTYCPYCIVQKSTSTVHCVICNVCVDEYDHHCFWVNNCVGEKNFNVFVLFIVVVLFNLLMNIILSGLTLIFEFDIQEKTFPHVYIFLETFSAGFILWVKLAALCISSLFFFPLCMLVGFNLKKLCNKKKKPANNHIQFEKLKIHLLENYENNDQEILVKHE